MQAIVNTELTKLNITHARRKKLLTILLALSVLVMGTVFWLLRLNGISMSGDAYCGCVEHQHTESCMEKRLVCTQEDGEHTHSDSCYEIVYTCGFEPDYSHVHTLQCYSNPNADWESKSSWESSLKGVELSGEWGDDLLAIAETQLGYEESTKNYLVDDDGITSKGITRYGQWYGNAYGDWCAMFISWCLNYADIPEDYLPYEASCSAWTEKLTKAGCYTDDSKFVPEPGDIIFFDKNQDGLSDHVGIVSELTYDREDKLIVHTIEGNSNNKVREQEYEGDSPVINGYCNLSTPYMRFLAATGGTAEHPAHEAIIFTDASYSQLETDSLRIVVAGVLPEGAVVYAYPVELKLDELNVLCAYDITIFLEDGSTYEPSESMSVQFIAPELAAEHQDNSTDVYYIPDDAAPEPMEAEETGEGVVFEAEHFSTYAWVQNGSTRITGSAALRDAVNGARSTVYLQLGTNINISSAYERMTLQNGAKVTIDLNGHTISAYNGANQNNTPLFTVPAGAQLTIIDTKTDANPGETERAIGAAAASDAGMAATVTANSNGSVTLNYAVTKSVINDTSTGKTSETRYMRTVTSQGMIRSTASYPLFSVTGGTLNIGSGFIYGDTATDQAIEQSGGTVNISGGYICGFTQQNTHNDAYYGGAVRVSGGTLNVSEAAVLAGNKAPTGGAIAALGGTVNISGGVISGNTATLDCGTNENNKDYGGGGIYARGTTVNMSGGYLTNNIAICRGYFNGGGGILLYSSTMNMSNGYITGNQAASGGGIRTAFNNENHIYISGGSVCANYARSAEGGGICIDNQGTCDVDTHGTGKIFVNNNATNTSEHWGGGGLFVANGGSMFINGALITDNNAGGYGGGVAGCSTGRVVIALQNGAAIYNNTAEGQHLSGSTSTKNDDNTYAALSEIFLRYGYADYYCALASTVFGGMLGEYAANWSGSMDGQVVANVGANTALNSSYIMGLTAHPSMTAITAAQEKASVYINGNSSYTHGGGVLSNGILIVGNITDFSIGDSLQLEADKALLDGNGNRLSVGEGDFRFEVVDEMNNVVSVGTTKDGGGIYFDRRLAFETAGVFNYILREADSADASVVKDTTEYALSVTVVKDTKALRVPPNDSITYYFYRISHLKLTAIANGVERTLYDSDVNSSESSAYHYSLPNPTFTNYKMQSINMTVKKQWEGRSANSATVQLYRNGKVYNTQTLSRNNGWTYTWEDLPTADRNGNAYSYEIKEIVPDGYVATYTTANSASAGSYWVPATSLSAGEQYIIVNANGDVILKETAAHANAQFTSDDTGRITRQSGTLTLGGNNYTTWYNDADITAANIFTATLNNHDGVNRLLLKNSANPASSLLVQGGSGDSARGLKGCDSDYYGSSMKFENGRLMGQFEWNQNNAWYYIVYANNRFNASNSNTNAARLYTRVSGPISQSTTVTITNTAIGQAKFTMNVTKQDADDGNIKLPNATFRLLDSHGDAVGFVGGNGSYAAVSSGSLSGNVITDIVTVANGRLVLTELPAGTYTLHEVAAPEGYYTAEDTTVTLGTGEGTSVFVTIEDKRIDNLVLPETGGSGIVPYALGGLLITSLAAYLLYIQNKRRKEDCNRP